MNRNYGLCMLIDRIFDKGLIDVHGVGTYIDKYRLRTPEYKRISSGNKCVSRHDNFIPRLYVKKKRRQLRSVRTGRGKKNFRRSGLILQPF